MQNNNQKAEVFAVIGANEISANGDVRRITGEADTDPSGLNLKMG